MMKLSDNVPERKVETLSDRLEYCINTLQRHSIINFTIDINAIHTLKSGRMDEEDIAVDRVKRFSMCTTGSTWKWTEDPEGEWVQDKKSGDYLMYREAISAETDTYF